MHWKGVLSGTSRILYDEVRLKPLQRTSWAGEVNALCQTKQHKALTIS